MKLKVLFICMLSWFLSASVMAQEGHPLAGIWIGDWGPTANSRNFVLLEMNWIDMTISGNINPGFPDAAVITNSELNSSNWTVHVEASGMDENGNTVTTIFDGQLEDLGSPKRTLGGTWRQGNISGDFSLTRD